MNKGFERLENVFEFDGEMYKLFENKKRTVSELSKFSVGTNHKEFV